MKNLKKDLQKRLLHAILKSKIVAWMATQMIRLYSSTFRIQVRGEERWLPYVKEGGNVILSCWHQQFFTAIGHFSKYMPYHPTIMISRSIDGEIVSNIGIILGWKVIRGSSSRDKKNDKGGTEALQELVQHMRGQGQIAVHIVDGPRGPIGKVKSGLINLATATKAKVVPFSFEMDRKFMFRSWDRFLIPKPFAKVTLHFDGPIEVRPDTQDKEDYIPLYKKRIEEIMLPRLEG